MADGMIVAQALVAAAVLTLAGGSGAQALTDPTRPPVELAAAGGPGAASSRSLQSILISSTRQGAIINGKYVPLGGTYEDARLITITATEVTLKSRDGTEVLKLYPGEQKISAAPANVPRPPQAGRRP
jgi:hypothetical protein